MQKNVSSQKWVVFAFDRTDNTPKTGDAANITAKIKIDSAAAAAITDTNPTEIEDGYYEFDLTQAETNGNRLLILPESSTADIQVIGCPAVAYTNPPNYQTLGIESDGDLTKVNTLDGHTAQTGDGYAEVTSVTYGLSVIENLVDELESRLTALRAGYLDNLNVGGNVASSSEISALNDPTAAAIADAVWDEAKAGHVGAGSFGEEVQAHSLSTEIAALNNLNSSDVQTACDSAITANTDINNIDTGVNNIEAKLPTNYIMGSSVQTDKDDEVDAVKTVTDKLDTAMELDGAVYRFTTNALEQAPSGSGGDATAANQTTIINHLTSIKDNNAGADFDSSTDSLEAIRNRGDAAWTTGTLTGSNEVTLTIQDGDAANVVEAYVEIWDSAGTTFYERRTTNSEGQTIHNLDDGTYTVKIHKAGYTFTNQTLIVDGVEAETYTGAIFDTSNVDTIRVYDYCLEPDGDPVASITATATIISLPYDYDGAVYSGETYTGIYDAVTGLVYWDIVKGARVRFIIAYFGINTVKTVPSDVDTVRLSDMT
ncbi:MAG: hypothetical protein ACFFG0_02285 [Candidatus Thorarchaeota archaeon]